MIILLSVILVDIILALNILVIKSFTVGAIFLSLYLLINGYLAGNIIKKLLDVKESAIRLFLGIFLVFSLVSTLGGVFIILYRFDNAILSVILFTVSLCLFLIFRSYSSIALKPNLLGPGMQVYSPAYRAGRFIKKINLQSPLTALYIAIALLFSVGFYTLFSSSSPAMHLITPWQAIPSQFVWVIALLSILILGFVFFKPKKYLLVFIVLFSLLQHLYIPTVYRLPYGLDDWRHIGSMEKIIANGVIEPYGIIQGITSPKLSYSNFWAGTLFLRKSLNINLIDLTPWWQALFFSLFLPILMYVLGMIINKGLGNYKSLKGLPLLAAFLPALFYPIQLYGAISLPVGFNFLFFLFFLITAVTWLRRDEPLPRLYTSLIALEFILMFFGYVIYWLMAGLIIGFLVVYKLTKSYRHSIKKKLARIAYLLASLFFIPIISLWASPNSRFDVVTTQMDYFRDFWAHNLQYFFGFKAIGSPRPQAGNLIWHDMRQNFVDIFPFNWQYFDTILIALFLVLIFFGLRHLFKKAESSATSSLILYLFLISVGAIFLDRYYFGGIHLLTERMDLIVNASLIFILIYSIQYLISTTSSRAGRQYHNILISLFLIAVLSFTVASTYISGPVYGRATEPHYRAAKWIYQDMQENNRLNYCVLSEHFPLAALEAASGGKIINGNFPIKYGYLEKSGRLFIKMFSQPNIKWIKGAMKMSNNSSGCYLVLDSRFIADWNKQQILWILGREKFKVDDVLVWVYHKT
jgi:hypothetical protein